MSQRKTNPAAKPTHMAFAFGLAILPDRGLLLMFGICVPFAGSEQCQRLLFEKLTADLTRAGSFGGGLDAPVLAFLPGPHCTKRPFHFVRAFSGRWRRVRGASRVH